MEVSNPRPLLPPRDERHQRVAAVVCSEEAVVLLRESGWVYLMGTSPVWHPQCPGSPPVLPHPLGPTCVALHSPGTFSGETWWHVFWPPRLPPHALIGSDAPSCRGRPVFWSWRKSAEAAGPGWPARSQTRGPRSQKILALGSSAPTSTRYGPEFTWGSPQGSCL